MQKTQDVKLVGDDPGVGEEAASEGAKGLAKIHDDVANILTAWDVAESRIKLTDTLPVTPMQSSTVSQGASCSALGTSVTCNLGAMSAGASATVTMTVAIGNVPITNSASVKPCFCAHI